MCFLQEIIIKGIARYNQIHDFYFKYMLWIVVIEVLRVISWLRCDGLKQDRQ